MRLFAASKPIEFIAMDIVGPYPETVQSNQYILVTKNRYSKLTRALSTLKTTAIHVANVYMVHWLVSYGIQTYLLTDNQTRFVIKFIATVCTLLRVKHLTTTAYHPQTNAKVDRFNKIIFTRL